MNTPLGCFLSPRAASEKIRSLQLRISELEERLFTLQHAQQAKADRTSRFRKEALRKAKHPAHVIQIWDEVQDPSNDIYDLLYGSSGPPRPREGEGAGGEGSLDLESTSLSSVLFQTNKEDQP